MKIIIEDCSIRDFDAWSGGKTTQERIIEEDKCDEFDFYIEELFPDGIKDVELNDMLWFDRDSIYEYLGIEEDE